MGDNNEQESARNQQEAQPRKPEGRVETEREKEIARQCMIVHQRDGGVDPQEYVV